MRVCHYSENGSIGEFIPRPPKNHPEAVPAVWAIDDWHSPLYFVPSDCPRVAFWPLPTTTEEDRRRWWPDDRTRMVIAIEHGWLDRLIETPIYRYEFSAETFEDCNDHGVFVSRIAVSAALVEPVGPSLAALRASAVELRLLPSLSGLADQIRKSTLHWSLIRMRNAEGWNGPLGRPTMPGSG